MVDTVIHNFLSARGEEGWGGWASPPPLSEHDTGISSVSGHAGGGGRHRDGCPNGSSSSFNLSKPVATPVPPQSTTTGRTPLPPGVHPAAGSKCGSGGPPSEASSRSGKPSSSVGRRRCNNTHSSGCKQQQLTKPVVNTISLAVDNPLYDSLPVTNNLHTPTCDINQSKHSSVPAADSSAADAAGAAGRSASPTASLISDSIAYCGRWPPADRRMCPQCGELLADCPHRDLGTKDKNRNITSNIMKLRPFEL